MKTQKDAHAQSRIALVTGAASGIGFAISQHLANQNCTVYLSDASLAAAEEAAGRLTGKQLTVIPVKLDVTSDGDIERLVAVIGQKGRSIDILVNNAGLQHVAQLEHFPPDKWKLLVDILLTGPAMLVRALLPGMRQRDFGRIINIGSIHSLVASPFKSAYVAAKHGLLGFSKVIALETANSNITINTICPSYVKTPLVDKQINDQAKANNIPAEKVINDIMLAPMPKKNFIALDEICSAVDYLASDGARNMTGQEIVLDGGWTCQ
jgi:3-hydroxybutyrate dehydrogenase